MLATDYHMEGWNGIECFYFITGTLSTVGYGDYYPTTDASRGFTMVYILVGLVAVFVQLTTMAAGDV